MKRPSPSAPSSVPSPNAAGFDYFYGYTHARNIGTVIEQDKVEANVEEVETQPRLAKKVVGFLDNPARKEKPFFLYLPLCPPHTPIVPAPEFRGKSGTRGKEGQYGDWMYEGDWVLGQVLEALERQQACRQHPHHGQQRQRRRRTLVCAAARSEDQHLRRRSPRALPRALARQNQTRLGVRRHHLPQRPHGHLRGNRRREDYPTTRARTA